MPDKKSKSYRDGSRENVTYLYDKGIFERNDADTILQVGSLMRIADAMERYFGKADISQFQVLQAINNTQARYEKKIASLNTKISILNRRISKLEKK